MDRKHVSFSPLPKKKTPNYTQIGLPAFFSYKHKLLKYRYRQISNTLKTTNYSSQIYTKKPADRKPPLSRTRPFPRSPIEKIPQKKRPNPLQKTNTTPHSNYLHQARNGKHQEAARRAGSPLDRHPCFKLRRRSSSAPASAHRNPLTLAPQLSLTPLSS